MTLASNTILQLFKRWIALSTEESSYPWNYPIDTANYQMVSLPLICCIVILWLVDIQLSSLWNNQDWSILLSKV